MSSVISLQGVSKRFRRCRAVDEVSLEVPAGVVFALLGENGAGKTTLIRILTGFMKPDFGTAEVLGRSCQNSPLEVRRSVGYVSDSPRLYEWMTAAEIGWFTSAFYSASFPARYLELIADFDVPSGTPIARMSKGQRAKVALALATAHDPELLILDEPTSGLDPMVRRKFLESMVDRTARGRTVFLSSHQISEVERVADWVGIMHRGKLKVLQPLAMLKSQTSVVTATLVYPSAEPQLPPGEVITETRKGSQVRWLVIDLADDWQAFFDIEPSIQNVTVSTPTLEEIFVAVCDDRAKRPRADDEALRFAGMPGDGDRPTAGQPWANGTDYSSDENGAAW